MTCTLTTASGEQLYSKSAPNDSSGQPIVCSGQNAFGDCRHAARVRTNSKRGAPQNYGPHRQTDGGLEYYIGDMHITCDPPLPDGAVFLLTAEGGYSPVG